MRTSKTGLVLVWSLFGTLIVTDHTLGVVSATITLQPVAPKTIPPSNYPPGTTIVGQEIILGSVPARVWFEIHITGWSPEDLRTVQVAISATDPEGDGGGYLGANAVCMEQPSVNAGDLGPAIQPCNTNADCQASMTGTNCSPAPGRCLNYIIEPIPTWLPGPGRYCEPWFQDQCDPEWPLGKIVGIPGYDSININTRFGFTVDPSQDPVPDFQPTYLGTLILDIPANAKGTYTIDFDETQTFMQNSGPPENIINISAMFPAIVTISCGRCCSGYDNDSLECVDHVTEAECANATDEVFTAGQNCPAGGAVECPECASAADCDDGIACTSDQCDSSNFCINTPMQIVCDDGLFCNGPEVCSASIGCTSGTPPCEPSLCDEESDQCRAGIPTVSNWGMVILVLALLVCAKLRYGPRRQA